MPMPLDLVVKKALNSRSACSAEIPTPESVTLTRTWRVFVSGAIRSPVRAAGP